MKHYGPNHIQNMPMFALNNSVLLERMGAGCLVNNPIFKQKMDTSFLTYFKSLSVRNTRMVVEN